MNPPCESSAVCSLGEGCDNVYTGLMIFNSVEGKDSDQDLYLDKLSFGGCPNVFYKIIDVPHMRKYKTDINK